MQNKAFHRLLSQIDKLTPSQSKQLQNHIKKKCSVKTMEDATAHVDHCPHCGATNFYKWGTHSGLQRYKCKECNKTFNILTKTPLARLRVKGLGDNDNPIISTLCFQKKNNKRVEKIACPENPA